MDAFALLAHVLPGAETDFGAGRVRKRSLPDCLRRSSVSSCVGGSTVQSSVWANRCRYVGSYLGKMNSKLDSEKTTKFLHLSLLSIIVCNKIKFNPRTYIPKIVSPKHTKLEFQKSAPYTINLEETLA